MTVTSPSRSIILPCARFPLLFFPFLTSKKSNYNFMIGSSIGKYKSKKRLNQPSLLELRKDHFKSNTEMPDQLGTLELSSSEQHLCETIARPSTSRKVFSNPLPFTTHKKKRGSHVPPREKGKKKSTPESKLNLERERPSRHTLFWRW